MIIKKLILEIKRSISFTNNPKYFGKKPDETAKSDDDRRSSFNNKKSLK